MFGVKNSILSGCITCVYGFEDSISPF